MITVGHLINGQTSADGGRTQDVYNPSTGAVSKQVALASKATVQQAIAAATAAYPAWRNTPAIKRARVMFKFKDLLEQNAEKICTLIGEEHGKISHDAAGELQHKKFLGFYRSGNWEVAKMFASDLKKCWQGNLSDYYDSMISRIEDFQVSPPKDWDGVYRATSK